MWKAALAGIATGLIIVAILMYVAMRLSAAEKRFKQLVLDSGWELSVDSARSFEFRLGTYAVPVTERYRGKWRFDKHFYPVLAKLRDATEEFKCAVTIDSHPKVKHWVRNLERDVEGAFWLPTSYGKFFPDFVCELEDGRILVRASPQCSDGGREGSGRSLVVREERREVPISDGVPEG